MPTDCQKLENLQLMQQIEELRRWMYKNRFNLIEPRNFTSNSNQLQNLIREKEQQIKQNMKLPRSAEKNLNELGVFFQ